MATGDFKNNAMRLQKELKKMKYPCDMPLQGIKEGAVESYVPILRYAFADYSRSLAAEVQKLGLDMKLCESNAHFIEGSFRILRDILGYKPSLNREQFLQSGFVERKVIVCTEILQLVQKRYGRILPKLVKAIGGNMTVNMATAPMASLPVRHLPGIITNSKSPASLKVANKSGAVNDTVASNQLEKVTERNHFLTNSDEFSETVNQPSTSTPRAVNGGHDVVPESEYAKDIENIKVRVSRLETLMEDFASRQENWESAVKNQTAVWSRFNLIHGEEGIE